MKAILSIAFIVLGSAAFAQNPEGRASSNPTRAADSMVAKRAARSGDVIELHGAGSRIRLRGQRSLRLSNEPLSQRACAWR